MGKTVNGNRSRRGSTRAIDGACLWCHGHVHRACKQAGRTVVETNVCISCLMRDPLRTFKTVDLSCQRGRTQIHRVGPWSPQQRIEAC